MKAKHICCFNLCHKNCDTLSENGAHGHICLSVWLLANGTLWEGLKGMALLKELCHWG